MTISGACKKGFVLINVLLILMVLTLISTFSIRLYLSSVEHKRIDYVELNYRDYDFEIVDKINTDMKDRAEDLEELIKNNKIISLSDKVNLSCSKKNNEFKVTYYLGETKKEIYVTGEKNKNGYTFSLNSREGI